METDNENHKYEDSVISGICIVAMLCEIPATDFRWETPAYGFLFFVKE